MSNKVKFGLKNVRVFPIDSTDEDGKPTYGDVIRVPGAVNITLDPEESEEPFHADDVVYYISVANSGYTGSLEIANTPLAYRTEILGEVTGEDGVTIETVADKRKEFALAFEFTGDAQGIRHLFYRVSTGRPAVSGATKTDTATPQTDSLDLTAMGRQDNGYIKAYADADSAAYATWLESVHEPVADPAP